MAISNGNPRSELYRSMTYSGQVGSLALRPVVIQRKLRRLEFDLAWRAQGEIGVGDGQIDDVDVDEALFLDREDDDRRIPRLMTARILKTEDEKFGIGRPTGMSDAGAVIMGLRSVALFPDDRRTRRDFDDGLATRRSGGHDFRGKATGRSRVVVGQDRLGRHKQDECGGP